MINPKFQAGNSSLSSQADKQTVRSSQGIHANKVCIQKMVRINPDANQLFTGAFSGLNMPQFSKLGTGICVAKRGYIAQRQQREGVTYVKLGIPVYSAADQIYQGMLFVNLACSGVDSLGDHSVVKVLPLLWARAVDDGNNCWVSGLSPAEGEPEYNPFDYAIAQLPYTLNQAGGTAICASSLCKFLSEAFRLLTPEDRTLYLGIMLQSNRFPRFLKYAASTRSHHNGDHGLALHTAETMANVLLSFLAASPWQRSIGKPAFDLSLANIIAPLMSARVLRDKHATQLDKLMAIVYVSQMIGLYDRGEIVSFDWQGTNIRNESMGYERDQTSIQWRWFSEIQNDYDVIINDDGKGESADLVGLRVTDDHILLTMIHCKYSESDEPGARLQDLYEVCGQAQRCIRWKHLNLTYLYHHIKNREQNWRSRGYSRFLKGTIKDLAAIKERSRTKPIRFAVEIIQPGIKVSKINDEGLKLLGSTALFIKKTTMADLAVIGSK